MVDFWGRSLPSFCFFFSCTPLYLKQNAGNKTFSTELEIVSSSDVSYNNQNIFTLYLRKIILLKYIITIIYCEEIVVYNTNPN